MFEYIKNIQVNNKMFNLLNRPIVVADIVDKDNKKRIGRVLEVTGLSDESGGSYELSLTNRQYLEFLYQRLNKRRSLKVMGILLMLVGFLTSQWFVVTIGGLISLFCDAIWLLSEGGRRTIVDYLVFYILGLLIFGLHSGLYIGSAAIIFYIYLFDPTCFFELSPMQGLDVNKIKYTKKEPVKRK